MKLKDVLEKTTHFFREKGFPSARLDAEILLAEALNIDRIRLYLDFDRPLNPADLDKAREGVRRRGQGEPVAYITGYKDFYRSRFKVSPAVLIPRPETEQVVDEAIAWCKTRELTAPRIVDLGTGSGCLGLSVLKEIPGAKLLAVDLSPEALKIAAENAEALGLSERVTFIEGDAGDEALAREALMEAGFDRIDVLLANPPYIEKNDPRVEKDVQRFEPHLALYAGEKGLAALKAWTSAWSGELARPGLALMEMGLEQGADLKQYYMDSGFGEVQVLRDLSGHDRVIKGVKNG